MKKRRSLKTQKRILAQEFSVKWSPAHQAWLLMWHNMINMGIFRTKKEALAAKRHKVQSLKIA